MKLSEYILKTREERISHIDLETECELGTFRRRSRGGCVDLLNLIGVEDDIDEWTPHRIHRCHLCDCGRRKGECGNPRHIYIGTAQENQFDQGKEFLHSRAKKAGRPKGSMSDRTLVLLNIFRKMVEEDESFLSLSNREIGRRLGCHHGQVKKFRVHFETTTA